jgi:putative acetyltransferase
VILRPYRRTDAFALSALYRRSVEGLGPRFYAPPQVAVWASLAPTPRALDAMMQDGRARRVATHADGPPFAFGDLMADGLIDLLYAGPEAAGRGAAGLVCDALEAVARQTGVALLRVAASEGARGFFTRRGFRVTARHDFPVARIAIHNYAMEKRLDPALAAL